MLTYIPMRTCSSASLSATFRRYCVPLPFRKAGTALASSLLCSASASLGGELVSETGKAGQSIDPAVHCQAGLKRARYAHTRAALGRLPCCSGGAQDASDFHRAEPEVEAWPGSHSHSRTSLWEPRLGLCSLLHICHHICPAIMKMCSAVTADCHADDPVVRWVLPTFPPRSRSSLLQPCLYIRQLSGLKRLKFPR